MDRSVALLSLFIIILVSSLSAATTPPNVTAETKSTPGEGRMSVQQGEAAYINFADFADGLTTQIDIKCAWNAAEDIAGYEIWVDNGTQRTSLFKDRVRFGTGNLTLNSTTFRSGKYGCAVWSGNTVTNSNGAVYLARPPKLVLTQQEDVQFGELASFICHVKEEFSPRFNIHTEIDWRIIHDNNPHKLTSWPWTALGWKANGNKLVITKVQKFVKNIDVSVRCGQVLKGPKVALHSLKSNPDCRQGLCYWSNRVPILFAVAALPPTPSATPQYKSSDPMQVAAIVIGSIVLLALAIAPIVLIVVFFRRTRQSHQNDAERRLPKSPWLGQACAPLTIEERIPGVGSSRTTSYDSNPSTPVLLPIGSVMLTVPGTCDPYPTSVAMVTYNEQRHPQQAEGQDCR